MTAYATLTDLTKYGLNTATLSTVPTPQQQDALDAANDFVDSYLASRFKLPLIVWGKGLTQKVCEIASWSLLSIRGFDPEDAADIEVKNRYDNALKWLQDITEGEVTPNVTDSGQAGQLGGPNTLQTNTSPPSTQASPGGTLKLDVGPNGSQMFTGAPRQRGWR